MFVRTTRFKIKQGSMSQFREVAEGTKGQVSKMDGLLQSYSCVDDSGNGVLVAVWESDEKAKAGGPQAKAVWASIAEHLDGEPQVSEFRTVVALK